MLSNINNLHSKKLYIILKDNIKKLNLSSNKKDYNYFYIKELYYYCEQLLLQYYLVEIKYRKLAQIDIYDRYKPYLIKKSDLIKDIEKYIIKNNINYTIKNNKIFIYNPNIFDIKILDDMTGKLISQNLGEFYSACSDDENVWRKYNHYRIVIIINHMEIYAQMCKPEQISKYMDKIIKIYNELCELFYKFDNSIENNKSDYSRNNIKIYSKNMSSDKIINRTKKSSKKIKKIKKSSKKLNK